METQLHPPSSADLGVREAGRLADAREAPEGAAQLRRYINRELSQLDFLDRVLAMAEDAARPLLERVRFLAILGQSLDEFFQVRVAGLKEQAAAPVPSTSPDGMSTLQQLQAIHERVQRIMRGAGRLLADELCPRLAEAGVEITTMERLDEAGRQYVGKVFEDQILPVLTPLAVDPAHPFPYISHLSLSLAVMVRDPEGGGRSRFARVKVPPLLPRFVALPGGRQFVPLEDVINAHLDALFPGMDVESHYAFRVTRDADLELVDEEAADLLELIQTELQRQRRQARVVRLEIDRDASDEVVQLLVQELELEPYDVYKVDGLLDYTGLWAIYDLDRADLKEEPWAPVTPRALRMVAAEPASFFQLLRGQDILVHHPYESFATSVEAFIEQAALDPNVLAIKQTLYRTSGPASPIVRALIHAAASGKQVVALVELKARGDEQANIAWAQELEEAGVHVVYGVVGLKTHAKITLVVRQETSGLRRYVHIGTGNYNPRTALIYEDVGLLSSDPDLGADVSDLFNFLTGYSRQERYRKLLVAPFGLRDSVIALINREAQLGPEGRIVIKVNSLVDTEVVDTLYQASARGTPIELVVRGICCLRPGVPGLSDHIRVRSIVGRFLEHSRIFRFGKDPEGAEYYLGSSDLMPRNLDRRVEAIAPIEEPALRRRLAEILDIELRDDKLAWFLQADGSWQKAQLNGGLNSQRRFEELALSRSRDSA
jgi:polyphosphate kinase